MWNAAQYLQFSSERDRPFFDLLSQVPTTQHPRAVADLGCGTGHLTASLLQRFPEAQIWGLDSSDGMLESARRHAIPGRLEFVSADLREWIAPQPLEVIVSNAALQWVPDHVTLIPHLAAMLGVGGCLAVQMPANFDAPTHTILRELTSSATWNLDGANEPRHAQPLDWYLETLNVLGFSVNAWETTYQHVLHGENPVLEWVKGTALRPVLARLEGTQREAFLSEYGARLLEAYPTQSFGTVLPFKRAFFVASKEAQ
ncbi:MAG: methyltransferase domain-containing protein [Pleurocapsa sp. SU_196_0]|nr:methyltransferase domain-containing protein [Pleurocapsa sp. SU_196_0]